MTLGTAQIRPAACSMLQQGCFWPALMQTGQCVLCCSCRLRKLVIPPTACTTDARPAAEGGFCCAGSRRLCWHAKPLDNHAPCHSVQPQHGWLNSRCPSPLPLLGALLKYASLFAQQGLWPGLCNLHSLPPAVVPPGTPPHVATVRQPLLVIFTGNRAGLMVWLFDVCSWLQTRAMTTLHTASLTQRSSPAALP